MKFLLTAAFILPLAMPVIAKATSVSPCDVTGSIPPANQVVEGMPIFNLTQNCTKAFVSKEAAGDCITREKMARTKISSSWPTLSEAVKHICATRVPKETAKAYVSLADCAFKEGLLDKFRSTEATP
jgi:hypothetical protein